MKQIHSGKALKKIDLNLLISDVGAHLLSSWQAPSLIFQFWPISMTIYVLPALSLTPGLNSVAFCTYIIKFSDLKLASFMSYTHNTGVLCMGLAPVMDPIGLDL